MVDIVQFWDINAINKIISNTGWLLPPVTFIYLYILRASPWFFWLAIVALCYLGLYVSYSTRFSFIIGRYAELKGLSRDDFIGKNMENFISYMFKRKYLPVLLIVGSILEILSIVMLILNQVDLVTRLLFFLGVLTLAYYVGTLIMYANVAFQHPELLPSEHKRPKKTRIKRTV